MLILAAAPFALLWGAVCYEAGPKALIVVVFAFMALTVGVQPWDAGGTDVDPDGNGFGAVVALMLVFLCGLPWSIACWLGLELRAKRRGQPGTGPSTTASVGPSNPYRKS